MKSVYYISLLLLLFSCSKNRAYIRHTDLHHTNPINLYSIKETKDSIGFNINYGKPDSIITDVYSLTLSDTNFRYLKNKKVIQFYDSYYIRTNVKNKEIYKTYYNRDIKF